MRKGATSLRRAAVAVVVTTALARPMLSVAQAEQPAEQTRAAKPQPKKHAARTPRKQPQTAPQQSWLDKRCTWPYQNQYPPCMSTWPASDPNYHGGTHPGPTFDEPY